MRVLKKMSFDALLENVSNEEKKNILGGSGGYTSVTSGSGSGYNVDGLARALFFMLNSASNNQAMSSMTSSSSWSSGSQSNSGGNSNQGWTNTDGGVKTSNKSDISRFLEYISGQSNGQDIANFNPSMSDINSFVSNELKFSVNGGVITLPDGTVWGGQLNTVDVYHSSDPRSTNYNPYGQWTAKTIADVFQNIGDSISAGGISLTATGIGSGFGGAMMTAGGMISAGGTALEFAIDVNGNTWASFDGEKWLIKGVLEATNFGAGKLGMPVGAEAYYNAGSIGADRGIDAMREYRETND